MTLENFSYHTDEDYRRQVFLSHITSFIVLTDAIDEGSIEDGRLKQCIETVLTDVDIKIFTMKEYINEKIHELFDSNYDFDAFEDALDSVKESLKQFDREDSKPFYIRYQNNEYSKLEYDEELIKYMLDEIKEYIHCHTGIWCDMENIGEVLKYARIKKYYKEKIWWRLRHWN